MIRYNDYAKYLYNHLNNVKKSFELLKRICPEHLDKDMDTLESVINMHDRSKFKADEFFPYAAHFYTNEDGNENDDNANDYDNAWRLHCLRNPHHPEFWNRFDAELKNIPSAYIIEMACDWMAMDIFNDEQNHLTYFNKMLKDKSSCLYLMNEKNRKFLFSLLFLVNGYVINNNHTLTETAVLLVEKGSGFLDEMRDLNTRQQKLYQEMCRKGDIIEGFDF